MKRKKHVILSEESKDTIKRVYIPKHPKYGRTGLAKFYNVSLATIYNILKRRTEYENQ